MTPKGYEGLDPDTLEPGHLYRVDYKHVRLRRGFRIHGRFLGRETRTLEEGEEPVEVLLFEVKPRFGDPAVQPVDPATLQSIGEP
jgi:hypothetical protein